jgi:inorganic pyrophosphatase
MFERFLLPLLAAALLVGCASAGGSPAPSTPLAPGVRQLDHLTIGGERDFQAGFEPRTPDGAVRAVVEIPAGTLAKWEVKGDGLMHWDLEDGRPRVVRYLPYPVNYGIVPRAVLSKARGGDGDPLDVLVLGPALPRGALVETHVVGVIRLVDRGEIDDKLLAVAKDSPFETVRDLPELEQKFPGVTAILETWFAHYKGPERMEPRGFGDREEALALLERAIADWASEHAVPR